MKRKLLRSYFPYGMERQDDGRWVLFNRDYKPVGWQTSKHVKYGDHPVAFKLSRSDHKTLEKLSCTYEYDPAQEKIYFYDYRTDPFGGKRYMAAYLEKLQILMSLNIEDERRDNH